MEKFSTAMCALGMSTPASSLARATSVSAAYVGVRRERGVVNAGIAVRGGGELCPQSGIAVARDRKPFAPFSGPAVSGSPPV